GSRAGLTWSTSQAGKQACRQTGRQAVSGEKGGGDGDLTRALTPYHRLLLHSGLPRRHRLPIINAAHRLVQTRKQQGLVNCQLANQMANWRVIDFLSLHGQR
ncbi:unnamed protein product, partial [Protopolystoma xenopodis]